MITIAMYILLGVFVTLLLALFFLPMIWKRAVRLTKKRVLAEMPISHLELQAEKDMQRAEMAIELRRMEVTAEKRLDELTNHALKIDRLNKTLSIRDEIISKQEDNVRSLQDELSAQRQSTAQTQQELEETRLSLINAKEEIQSLEETKSHLQETITHLETGISENRIELVAQEARIDNYKDEISELTRQRTEETDKRAQAESQLNQRTAEWERNKERLEKLQEKLDTLQSELADKDATISSLTQQLERAKEQKPDQDAQTNQRLAEAETRRLEAEARIAALTMQLNDQQSDDEGSNIAGLIEGLQLEKLQLEGQLAELTKANADLGEALEEQKTLLKNSKEKGDLSPNELLLRDEIKNIAARLTDYTAKAEGEGSPIHSLLNADQSDDSEQGEQTEQANQADNDEAAQNSDAIITPEQASGTDHWQEVFSLADRIRKMGNQSKEKTTSN